MAMDLSELDAPAPLEEWRQASLFDPLPPRPVRVRDLPLAPGVKARDYGLRYYQQDAKNYAEETLSRVQKAMLVMATGTGKSVTVGAIVGDWPGDVLVLAHRQELVLQMVKHLERLTGEEVGVEWAESRSEKHHRIVVGSTDSFNEARCTRLGAERFSLVIADEFHHYLAPTYRKVLEFFMAGGAKLLGVTATPKRADAKAMGQLVDEDPFVFDTADAIKAGFLVPIECYHAQDIEVDLSGVETRLGDFVAGQLDLVMVKAVEGIVKETLRLYPGKRGIIFFPGVKSAELAHLRFEELDRGSTCFVHGKTNKYERPDIIRAFREGEYKRFVNVGIATEGFDDPTIEMVGLGRPTKSQPLHAQICGRGLRPLPGVIDQWPGREQAAERRAAIAASAKPHCLILDFVGNHTLGLMTPEDLLGGDYSEAEVELAKKKAQEKGGGNPIENLQAARLELLAIAAKAKSKVKSKITKVDPFAALGIERDSRSERFGFRPATEPQRQALVRMGFKENQLIELSKNDASRLLDERARRMDAGLASYKQLDLLKRYGVTDKNITFDRARAALDYIVAQNWKVRDTSRVHDILFGTRQPGEEG